MTTFNTYSKCVVTEKWSANHYPPLKKVIKAPSIIRPIKTLQSIPNKLSPISTKKYFSYSLKSNHLLEHRRRRAHPNGQTPMVTSINFLLLTDHRRPSKALDLDE